MGVRLMWPMLSCRCSFLPPGQICVRTSVVAPVVTPAVQVYFGCMGHNH